MVLMLVYISFAALGFYVGRRFKKKGKTIGWLPRFQSVAIVILIVLMGMRLGSEKEIVAQLDELGLISLLFTLLAILGSVVGVFLVRNLLTIDRKGLKKND